MFFPDRVVGIQPGARVLEIGPGGTPHPRSDEYLDLHPSLFADHVEAAYQRGSAAPLQSDKPITYYDGGQFPFVDQAFDYVICSHVLEHVPDVEGFLSEMFRIAGRGYIEFPTIMFEYVYGIPVHRNLLTYRDGRLLYLGKSETALSEFDPVQAFFLRTLEAGHTRMIDDLTPVLFEGFEWVAPFPVERAPSVLSLVPPDGELPAPSAVYPDPGSLPLRVLVRLFIARLIRPVRSVVAARTRR